MTNRILAIAGVLIALCSTLPAQVPQIMNYQGRVVVGTTNFDGSGQFKFALVNAAGTTTYWSNDGTSSAGSQPTHAVSLTVTKGLYSVLLGDTTIANMSSAIPATVFTNSDVRLRVWFNDGTNGSQLLAPDQRISAAGYAMMSGAVPDGAITSTKIANGAVGATQLAAGGVSTSQIADSSITSAKIGTGQVVKSMNGLSDAITLSAGSNITITPSGNTLTLSSTGGSGSNFWSLNSSGAIYDSQGGFVGIGTSSPAAELHIVNSSGNLLRLDGGNPHINLIDTNNSNALTSIGGQAGSFYVTNNTAGVLMQLTPGGFMGLGTTGTPTSPLHISGTTDAIRLTATHPDITFEDAPYTTRIQGNSAGIDLKSNGAVVGSNPGGIIHLDGVGTVGLGTTTPTHQLTIVKNSGTPSWTSSGWLGEIALDNSSAIAWGNDSAGNRFGMGHTNGGFLMWRTAADPGTTASAPIYDFIIDDTGRCGIGTNVPVAELYVNSAGGIGNPQGQLNQTTSGDFARLRFTSPGNSGWDVAVGGASNVMNFYAGATAKNVLTLNTNGTVSIPILSITGGSDVAEPFQMGDQTIEKGSVVVIDEAHPGRLKRSTRAYDKRVAGIVSGANGINPGIALHQDGALDGGQNVALSGRVYVQADTSNGEIEPGDMLTSSDVPGHAMKATDWDRAHGAVIGKAMSPLHATQGTVLVLVSLQ
jgi:hypothetical protein